MVCGLKAYLLRRYPCATGIINENQIPDIDYLYIHVNYLLHLCKSVEDQAADEGSPQRIIENLLHHLEALFAVLRPKKLLFLSVDGASPWTRVVTLQERRWSRHFNSEVDDDDHSLSSKPGTSFASKIHERLEEFIATKISMEGKWKNVQVVLSGHQVPGQASSKIMQYAKWLRGRKDWTPNARQCFFAGNFDYVLHGLALHEPYFLLMSYIEDDNSVFSVTYLSAIRGYIEEEFESLKYDISFQFNLESILDDWIVLLSIWGTDCVPAIPGCRGRTIMKNFPLAYIRILPQIKGYIYDKGILHLDRLEKLFNEIQNMGFDLPVPNRENYYSTKLGFSASRMDLIKPMVKEYLKGIHCFIQKVHGNDSSWSWYYPYHYAPLLEDFKELDTFDIDLEPDSPPDIFVPLVALQMKNRPYFAPKAFYDLVNLDESPVEMYFPFDIETDDDDPFNKTLKFPFIDPDILYSAMLPFYKLLTEDEQKRRTIDPLLIFSHHDNPPGNRSGYNVKVTKITSKQLEEEITAVRGLYPGTLENIHIGYPFLKHLEYEGESSKATLSLQVISSLTEEDYLKQPYVFVNWPNLIPAKPAFLVDGDVVLRWNGSRIERSSTNSLKKEVTREALNDLKTKCILTESQLILVASPYLGTKPNFMVPESVFFEPAWDPVPHAFPAQTVVTQCPLRLPVVPPCVPLSDYIPEQTTLYLLTPEHYGAEAEVLYIQDNVVAVRAKNWVQPPRITRSQETWKTLHELTKQFKAPFRTISSITDVLYAKNINVGLQLKLTNRNLRKVLGYTDHKDGNWLYSSAAVNVIQNYITQFPEILGDVKRCSVKKLQEMAAWVTAQTYHNLKLSVSCDRLQGGDIDNLIGTLSRFTPSFSEHEMQVHPKDLYKPVDDLGAGPDPTATHEILDRVICVRSNYLVPLGSQGTIIGMQGSGPKCFWVYDILFDMYANQGQVNIVRMSSRAFLNFDYGERLPLSVRSDERPLIGYVQHENQPRNEPREELSGPTRGGWKRGGFLEKLGK